MTTFTTTAYGWFQDESIGPQAINNVSVHEISFVGTSNLALSYQYTNEVEDWEFVDMTVEEGAIFTPIIDGYFYPLEYAYTTFASVTLENGDSFQFATLQYGDYDGESQVFLIPIAGDYQDYLNEDFGLSALFDVMSQIVSEDNVHSGTFAEHATFTLYDLPEVTITQDDFIEDFSGVNFIVAGAGDDEIYAMWGNDTINAGAGNDYILPGEGKDKIIGGKGWDQVSYNETDGVTQGVTVNLAKGFAIDNWGYRDTIKQVEAVRGSSLDDTLIGNRKWNMFRGLEGEDTIKGGAGSDEVRYDFDVKNGGGDGVTVNLGKGFAIDGFGDRDKLVSIERVLGSDFNDKLIGNRGKNYLSGLDGNDVILGGGGADTLVGGAGNDVLKGQGGADVFMFDLNSGRDKIFGFSVGNDKIDLVQADIAFDELSFSRSGKFVLVEYEDVDILVRGASLDALNDADNFVF